MENHISNTKLALLLMVKNEAERVSVTIDSVSGHIGDVIIYDTGSTDSTIDVVKSACQKNGMKSHVFTGEFVDFAASRNRALELASDVRLSDGVTHVLFADSNDDVRGCDSLVSIIEETNKDAYMVKQEWAYGCNPKSDVYYNYKVFKLGCGIHYKGRVHEWPHISSEHTTQTVSTCTLYQDRSYDAHKSVSRFPWDYAILKQEVSDNGDDTRSVFYLAQTCACMGRIDESIEYYTKRYHMMNGFWEERFHSCMRIYDMIEDKNDMTWIYNSLDVCIRVEPLLVLVEKMDRMRKYSDAYAWALMAVSVPYPSECVLYVDSVAYEYKRYHWMSRVAFYAAHEKKYDYDECMTQGYSACKKACESKYASECDFSNIKFYIPEIKINPNEK